MTYYITIPSLAQRAAACPCCTAVLNDIALQESKGFLTPNAYGVQNRLKIYSQDRIKNAMETLCNLEWITVSFGFSTGNIKAPKMTDLGWPMVDVDKPFWMSPQ